jgi:hypothetical protein
MSFHSIKKILLCMVLLSVSISLYCQIEGESEVTTIIIKRPETSNSGSDDTGKRVINDFEPPRIEIISPRLDNTSSASTVESSFFLIGRLFDDSGIRSLTVNDEIVAPDENGFFQQSYTLEAGLNVFRIDATDELSNASSHTVYLIKDEASISSVGPDELDAKGEYYGLIIGINEYEDPGLVDLDNPITDATLLYSTLIGNYMFSPENVTLLKNPTRADIIKRLDELSYRLSRSDNLLIFYAGHGYWDSEKETGFWLPADAENFSSVNWIRNSTIQDYVDDINTNHTLLITDACFAGSIFKSRGAFQDASMGINRLYSLTSRKAMTSGTLKEVPDRSVFLEYFLKRLLENEHKYISASELFYSFREAVLNNSSNIPQYGVIQDTGDEGGDFIFIKR